MNDVTVGNNVFQELSIENKKRNAEKPSEELGQKAFLKLMITQLEHQDPLNPQENSAFIAQLAQFSSVESLDRLNNNFDSFTNSFMANQALQASSLVGRSVTVPSETTRLDGVGVVTASADIPASTQEVNVRIYNEAGELVETIAAGPQPKGEFVLRWDGQYAEVNGNILDWSSSHPEGLPPGNYRFNISAPIDGENTQLDSYLSANVNSVTLGKGGNLILNLAGIGAVKLSDVKQFNE